MAKSAFYGKTEKIGIAAAILRHLLVSAPGGDPSRGGGFHLQTGGQKMEIFLHVCGAEGAAKNFWALFSKFLWNLLIKMQ